jgi:hypothetical protein
MAPERRLVCRNYVQALVCWAIDQKDVGLTNIVPCDCAFCVASDAPRVETNSPATDSSGLALGSYELTLDINDEVISVVEAEWDQHVIAPADELTEDGCLGSEANLDWVRRVARAMSS